MVSVYVFAYVCISYVYVCVRVSCDTVMNEIKLDLCLSVF